MTKDNYILHLIEEEDNLQLITTYENIRAAIEWATIFIEDCLKISENDITYETLVSQYTNAFLLAKNK